MRDTLPFVPFLAAVGRYRERRHHIGLEPADHAVIRNKHVPILPSSHPRKGHEATVRESQKHVNRQKIRASIIRSLSTTQARRTLLLFKYTRDKQYWQDHGLLIFCGQRIRRSYMLWRIAKQ
jgi:hypothetical protein